MVLQRIARRFCLALLLCLATACAFFEEGEEDVKPDAPKKTAATPAAKDDGFLGFFGKESAPSPVNSEQELKLARLWARVDELEEEQYRQKERVRILEKGLTLGLIPEELRKGAPPKAKPAAKPEPAPEPEPKAPEPAKAGLTKEEAEKYQAALAGAHDHYRAGRYGRAIVEYDAIGKQWGDKVDSGMHEYWVARCWVNLKEYNTARQHLVDFLKSHPTSAWVPRAKLELARVEWRLGLGETALKRLRDIIKDHPYEDAAEMAKMELSQLAKTL